MLPKVSCSLQYWLALCCWWLWLSRTVALAFMLKRSTAMWYEYQALFRVFYPHNTLNVPYCCLCCTSSRRSHCSALFPQAPITTVIFSIALFQRAIMREHARPQGRIRKRHLRIYVPNNSLKIGQCCTSCEQWTSRLWTTARDILAHDACILYSTNETMHWYFLLSRTF